MENNYQYRGIYDESEMERINSLLEQQREGFNRADATENSLQNRVLKYGVILLGIATILVTLKFIKR